MLLHLQNLQVIFLKLIAAYESSGINGLGNESITFSDKIIAASLINILDGNTTGVIDASTLTELTGNISEINSAYESSGINGLGNESITFSDKIIAASLINILDGNTTGTVNASSVISLAGTSENLMKTYTSAGITGLGDERISITGSTASAAALNTIDSKNTGIIDASTITKLTGTGANALTVFNSGDITGLKFDAANYLASYGDLITAFSTNTTDASTHYFTNGIYEGRSFDSFDEWVI